MIRYQASELINCRVFLDKVTIRGCLPHKMEEQCTDENCTFCRSDKCNDQVFPENRLSCLHCEGASCVNQTNNINVRYFCANYDPADECYTVFSHSKFQMKFIW